MYVQGRPEGYVMANMKVYIAELNEIRRVGGDAAYVVKVVSLYEEKLRAGGKEAQRTAGFLQDAWIGSDAALERAFMIHVAKFLPIQDWEELQKTKKKRSKERQSGAGKYTKEELLYMWASLPWWRRIFSKPPI